MRLALLLLAACATTPAPAPPPEVDWCHGYHIDAPADRAALCIFTVDTPRDGGR